MTAVTSTAEESLRLRDWLPTLLSGRPHQVIGDDPAEPYLLRWFLIPRNPIVNVYRHRFCRSDPSAPHDHPWHFASIVLKGIYREISERRTIVRRPGSVAFRRASSRHRVELLGHPVTTVIITGPRCRRWGFWCARPAEPPAFVPWEQFGSGGCGEYPAPPPETKRSRPR
jgi:quercetin dioxygenase-like cupin family protein